MIPRHEAKANAPRTYRRLERVHLRFALKYKLRTQIKTMAHVGNEFVVAGIFVLIVVRVDGPLTKTGGGCCCCCWLDTSGGGGCANISFPPKTGESAIIVNLITTREIKPNRNCAFK